MIIFYDKESGRIIGTIDGRVHDPKSNMSIGDDTADKIVVNWKKNQEGVYEPDVADEEQKKLFMAIDKKPIIVYDYKVEVESEKLVKV